MALPFDDELTQFLAQNIWLDPLLLPAKFPLPTELITPPMIPSPLTTSKPTKNKSHNAIERRYRNNINERIAELKAAVPALQYTRQKADDDEDSEEYVDGVAVASKLNKATIMRKATEYIVHLQHTNDQLKAENQILEQLVRQLPGGAPVLARYKSMKREEEQETSLQDQQDPHQQHTFMALFLCLSFSMDQNITSSAAANTIASSASSDVWSLIRASLLVICLVYLLFRRRHEEKQNTFMLICSLAAECVQLGVRHMFGWTHATDEDEAERWMDIHARPSSSPLLRLYACARMMNVAAQSQLTYVYACAAMQFYPYSQWLARYFWRLAMYETDDDMLVWDVHQQPPCEDAMLDSQAWKEAVERGADLDGLSRLHLLDNLRTELGRLVISVTSSPPPFDKNDEEETAFERILANDDHKHPFPRWLAAVGATVEALWQSDVCAAERALAAIEHKDNLLKIKIKTVLQAAIRLKQGDLTGIDLLNETNTLQKKIKKELGYRRQDRGPVGLEGETMALAEFVVCLTGLHAWIDAWRLGAKVSEQIKAQTLVLRRMMRCSSLEKLPAHQILVDRLSRLGYFVSPNGSDDEEDDDDDDEQTRHAKTLDILRGLA
ncbi:helix-loop-helix DNA-binding domain-containing protein [Fennellomyces sp. T-0311]|nr:helix-loop-helix DNA-binding domain-containing protein [Fennellomyces sp. T-0311]